MYSIYYTCAGEVTKNFSFIKTVMRFTVAENNDTEQKNYFVDVITTENIPGVT